MSVLGIDIGTSGCRVVAFDEQLRELSYRRDHRVRYRAGGRGELDANEVLAHVAACISATTEQVDSHDPVTAISVSAVGEAVIAVDAVGRPLGPAPVSTDLRGRGATAAIARKLGAERWRGLTGQPIHPMFSIGKIASWRADRALWTCIARVHTFADLVTTWLGGRAVMDFTAAARTLAFDVDRRMWSADVLDLAQVDAHLLPEPVPVGTPLGVVSTVRRRELGFSRAPQLYAGAHDQACAFWGGGGTAQTAVFSLGTTECLTTASTGRPDAAIAANIASYPVDDGGEWLTLNGIPSGGSALNWVAQLVGRDDVRTLVAALRPEPSPLLFLPHLAGSGTMDNDPSSTGVIVGLTLTTTADDLATAIFEASGFELARNLDYAERTSGRYASVKAVGGGSSPPTLQRRADAAGRSLTAVPGPAAARGAAAVALCGLGLLRSRSAASERITTTQTFSPAATSRLFYQMRRTQYTQLYIAIRAVATTFKED